jgi:hypothetical protein
LAYSADNEAVKASSPTRLFFLFANLACGQSLLFSFSPIGGEFMHKKDLLGINTGWFGRVRALLMFIDGADNEMFGFMGTNEFCP